MLLGSASDQALPATIVTDGITKTETITITARANGDSDDYMFEAQKLVLQLGDQVDIRIIDEGQAPYYPHSPGDVNQVKYFFFDESGNDLSILAPKKRGRNSLFSYVFNNLWSGEPYQFKNGFLTDHYYIEWVAQAIGESTLSFSGNYDSKSPSTGMKYLRLPVKVIAP